MFATAAQSPFPQKPSSRTIDRRNTQPSRNSIRADSVAKCSPPEASSGYVSIRISRCLDYVWNAWVIFRFTNEATPVKNLSLATSATSGPLQSKGSRLTRSDSMKIDPKMRYETTLEWCEIASQIDGFDIFAGLWNLRQGILASIPIEGAPEYSCRCQDPSLSTVWKGAEKLQLAQEAHDPITWGKN